MKNLQPKTIVANTAEEIDRLVKAFGKDHRIAFTTPVPMPNNSFQRLILYEPDATEELAEGPTANALAQQAEEEKPTEWATCRACKKNWKISHYESCVCSNRDKNNIIGPRRKA